MSWKATSWAKDILVCPDGSKITRTEKLLLMVMADQHTTHQGYVFVSQKSLAEEALLSIRHLRRCIDSLERKGIVKTETGLGRGNLSGYSFPPLDPKKEDSMASFENSKSGHPESEKRTFQIVKEDIPRHTLSKEVELKSGTGKVEQTYTLVSPPPGDGSSEKPTTPLYDFSVFRKRYPDHRMKGHEKAAREAWSELKLSANEVLSVIATLDELSESDEWLKEDGRYVPLPEKFLKSRRWEIRNGNGKNPYAQECEEVREYFVRVTRQPDSANKMTPDRELMIRRRFREAVSMSENGSHDNAKALMLDAIDACRASPYYEKHPDALSLESVFSTPEKFEKWVKREIPA